MLTAERRRSIIHTLQRDGKVLASELSRALHVSEDTIRRDLRELASAGALQRVHGGALPRSPATASFTERQQQVSGAKVAIARAAVGLIRQDQVIILDGGTTPLQVAQHLPSDLRATVITHSPPIALALAEHPLIEVILIRCSGRRGLSEHPGRSLFSGNRQRASRDRHQYPRSGGSLCEARYDQKRG